MVEIEEGNEKVEEEIVERKFKVLTVGIMKNLGMQPLDLFRIDEVFPHLKNHPFKFTWEIVIPLHNELADDGIKITDDTSFPEATKAIMSLMNSGFLE